MSRMASRQHKHESVEAAAKERIRNFYQIVDQVTVQFSGGKDSTVLLNLAAEVAAEEGRLPLQVWFVDEEVIPPETVDYSSRVAVRPDLEFIWSCVPVVHRNGCSREAPWWRTWDPACPELWVRERPTLPCVVTAEDRPDIPILQMPEQSAHWFKASSGTHGLLLGRRTQESLTRYRMIASRHGDSAYRGRGPSAYAGHIMIGDPIYDFSSEDVWLLTLRRGWDYNRAYDVFSRLGISSPLAQRVGPPFGEEPARGLWMWQRGWPDLWDRMQARVPGAATAARWYRTALYGFGGKTGGDDDSAVCWEDRCRDAVMAWSGKDRATVASNIADLLRWHGAVTAKYRGGIPAPMPDLEDDPDSGLSWKRLTLMARRGMLKRRSLAQRTVRRAK